MTTQMTISPNELTNYGERSGDVTVDVQQLANGHLKLENYGPIRELERIKIDGNRALETAHFATDNDKKMAESLQSSRNAWIDTVKDGLSFIIDVYGLAKTCRPAIEAGVLTSMEVTRATELAASMGITLKRMYDRASTMAVKNSNDLLSVINSSDTVDLDETLKIVVEQHRIDLEKFQQGEVKVNVPKESYAELIKSLEQTGLDQKPNVREKIEPSSLAWSLALPIGSVALAGVIIIGFIVWKP